MLPLELRIRLDQDKNIVNKESIISYINDMDNKNLLINYLNAVISDPSLVGVNISDILLAIKERITLIDKNESTFSLLNNIISNIIDGKIVPTSELNYLTNFLNVCVKNEEEGIINSVATQRVFDRFYSYASISKNYITEDIKNILARKDLLNSRAYYDDYNDYDTSQSKSNVKVLSKTNNNTLGHPLTDDDYHLNKAAFVATTIILEGSLVLALILGLIALVNK